MSAIAEPQRRDIRTLLDPLREPSWRAMRALHLVDSGAKPRKPSSWDDEAVRRYRKFLIEWRRRGDSRRDRLFLEDPGICLAHNLYHNPDREWRAILEARILAREPDDVIAFEFATCPEMVRLYHDLFFDVRDRIHSRMYITKMILGPYIRRVMQHDDVMSEVMRHAVYKHFGYFGGSLVLDVVVTGFNATGIFPNRPNQIEGWFDDAFKTIIKQRALTTAHTFTVTRWNCMELLQMHISLLAQAQAAASGGGGQLSDFHQSVEAFLEQVPLAIGDKAQEGRTQATLHFEKTAVEPRADEMLLLANNAVPETLTAKVASTASDEVTNEPTDG